VKNDMEIHEYDEDWTTDDSEYIEELYQEI
jgi:hypothetical protein